MWKKPINPDGVGFVLVCNPKVETVDFNLGLCCGIPLEFHSLSGLALGYRFAVYLGEFFVGLHQFFRDRAGFAVADDALVDLYHRHDLRTGAGGNIRRRCTGRTGLGSAPWWGCPSRRRDRWRSAA